MMKKRFIKAFCAFICTVSMIAGLSSCKSETGDSKSSDKQLLTFGFNTSKNTTLTADATGTIDQSGTPLRSMYRMELMLQHSLRHSRAATAQA